VPVTFVVGAGGAPAAPAFAETVLAAWRARLATFRVPDETLIVETLPRSMEEKVAKARTAPSPREVKQSA
jgi:acyl-coenzyme A synthetase/AMP-(fatty) acid ligase